MSAHNKLTDFPGADRAVVARLGDETLQDGLAEAATEVVQRATRQMTEGIAQASEREARRLLRQFLQRYPEEIVRGLLAYVGEDPDREGLRETPARVLKAYREWTAGYGQDVTTLFKTFADGAEGAREMVIVHNIPVVSKCEHHLADITGIAHVGYIPDGKIVGLSKLARVTDLFARRLQVQERLTAQIADAIEANLAPLGVGVVIRAAHACMSSRGVKVHESVTTTSAMRGALLTKPEARAEFMALCRDAERTTG